jgi:hypothetical protein
MTKCKFVNISILSLSATALVLVISYSRIRDALIPAFTTIDNSTLALLILLWTMLVTALSVQNIFRQRMIEGRQCAAVWIGYASLFLCILSAFLFVYIPIVSVTG